MHHHESARHGPTWHFLRLHHSTTNKPPPPVRHHNHYNNHYQFDFNDKPKFKTPSIPCTSQHHIDPKPYAAYLQKARKSTSAAAATAGKSGGDERRKSNGDLNDGRSGRSNSSRYLLNNPIFVSDLGDSGGGGGSNAGALVVSEMVWPEYDDRLPVIKKSLSSGRSRGNESPALVKSRSSLIRLDAPAESSGLKSSRSRSRDQVVELRVSIHCKGCEGKVRKHISRMEGVKSFRIDLESKKVTIVGDVTPLSVLSSISKVKSAQLWSSPSQSASSSPFIAIGY